jgi:hypothetical protein
MCGQKPDPKNIIERYQLKEYEKISESVFQGDLNTLETEIN